MEPGLSSRERLSVRRRSRVTRQSARSPTGMHGQNMASGNGVTFALNSPLPVLADCGSVPRCASAALFPVEASFSIRPFTLLQRRLILRSAPAAGSTFLAYIFETIHKFELSPFGLAFPPSRCLFVALRGAINTLNPLPNPIPELSRCLQAFTPLWDLSIPRDHSARPDSNRRSLPLRVARSSFCSPPR